MLFQDMIKAPPSTEIPLWASNVPGALGNKPEDIPTLTPFLTETEKSSMGVVVCPGGGYWNLADHEGIGYAEWLNQNGIKAFLLKYRLASNGYRHPVMLGDAARALRLVRANASKWNLDPQKIGIMGSSAGGHLASTLLTHFDGGMTGAADPIERVSSRPDFGILCYPVITMGENTNEETREHLLGRNPGPELIQNLSSERKVTHDTSPCFIWHTYEDEMVKVENSLDFAMALRKAGVPFDLHIYTKGVHGIGLGDNHRWPGDLLFWLKSLRLDYPV
jgi:acetyl esterase/lipase